MVVPKDKASGSKKNAVKNEDEKLFMKLFKYDDKMASFFAKIVDKQQKSNARTSAKQAGKENIKTSAASKTPKTTTKKSAESVKKTVRAVAGSSATQKPSTSQSKTPIKRKPPVVPKNVQTKKKANTVSNTKWSCKEGVCTLKTPSSNRSSEVSSHTQKMYAALNKTSCNKTSKEDLNFLKNFAMNAKMPKCSSSDFGDPKSTFKKSTSDGKRKTTTRTTATCKTGKCPLVKKVEKKKPPATKKQPSKSSCRGDACSRKTYFSSSDSDDFGPAKRKRKPAPKRSKARTTTKRGYDSWETESDVDCKTGTCPWVKKRRSNNDSYPMDCLSSEPNQKNFAENDRNKDNMKKLIKSNSNNYSFLASAHNGKSADLVEDDVENYFSVDSYEWENNENDDSILFKSNSDDDYQYFNDSDDLYVPQGIARKYDIEDCNIAFNSDSNEPQIIEIENGLNLNGFRNNNKNIEQENDDDCPQLVPITYETEKYFEDNMEMEGFSELHVKDSSPNSNGGNNVRSTKPKIMTPEIIEMNQEIQCFSQLEFEEENNKTNDKFLMENIMQNSKKMSPSVMQTINGASFADNDLSNGGINLKSKFLNGIDSYHVLVLLKEPIHFYGTLNLKLIAGSVEIYGYKLDIDETVKIYSPRGYCSLDIKPIKNEQEYVKKDFIKNKLLQKQYSDVFLKFELNELIKNYDLKNDALVLLTRNDTNKCVQMLKKYMCENLFPNLNFIDDRPFHVSEFILRCLLTFEPVNPINIEPKWSTINLYNNTKLLITGGKSVGKSTLLKYLINKNLKEFPKILLIDFDIGQPEVFVPQTVNACVLTQPLLGPGYFYNLEPKKATVFGNASVIISPLDYFKNVTALINYCNNNEEFRNIPWVINTMGYVKGMGIELIAAIIKYLNPTDVIQLKSSKPANNFEHLLYPDVINTIPMNFITHDYLNIKHVNNELQYHFVSFDSAVKEDEQVRTKESNLKAKDIRFAMMITKLASALGIHDWLTDVTPIYASYEDVEIVSFCEEQLSKEDLLEAINANVVYLCRKNENELLDCYGIGIVRAIDDTKKMIYLLPAISSELWENINCLAICNIPLPSTIMLNQGPKVTGQIPFAYNTNDFVGSKYIHQLYNRGKNKMGKAKVAVN